jgi:hypothetical protein
VSNGTISSGSITGTYVEESNGLETVQITPEGFSTMNFNAVMVADGNKLLLIETDTGAVLAGTLTM